MIGVDFGVIEGFKESKLPKIALWNMAKAWEISNGNKPKSHLKWC